LDTQGKVFDNILGMTNLSSVLVELREERDHLNQAIATLESLNGSHRSTTKAGYTATTKRTLSPAARRRIAAAQKSRWAKWRKQQKAT